ncbi:MAG TPA: hypothetical protein VM686_41640 [Polyangiaceae bacterium]|nr:hypothetical protein [Polyangiaceae bacterium]
MRSTQKAIRRCIDSFADDLIELADELIREQVEKALSRIKPPPAPRVRAVKAKAKAKVKAKAKAKAEKKAPRPKLSPVEKLERARARAAERAEARKRQKQLALPFSGNEGESSQGEPAAAGRRGRRKASVAPESAAQKPPAPLFVVKRTREGNVPLQRKAEAEAAAAAAQTSENAALPS